VHKPLARTDDDIVDDVVRLLDPKLSPEEVRPVVALDLMIQRELLAKIYSRDGVKKRRAAAKKLSGDIARVVASMKAAPLDLVLPGEEFEQVLAVHSRREAFYDYLVDVQHACQELIQKSATYDLCKRRCAEAAHGLMLEFSERNPTSYAGSPFRKITSRIFEHVTGRRDEDLERACEAVLRARRENVG
jgi:hypothetical protein